MSHSLKRRLIWILLGLTLSAWVASAVLTFVYASRVMQDQVDLQLQQYSDLVNYITQVFARSLDEGRPVDEPWFREEFAAAHQEPMVIEAPMHDGLSPALNIWMDQKLIAMLPDSPRFGRPDQEGFTFLDLGQSQWRILTRYDVPTGLWMRVGIELGEARWAMLETLARALLPLAIVLPLTVLLLYVGVSRGLLPLKTLAGQIARRKPGLLDPVETEGVPVEVQGVVASLNRLLERLAFALESEQRFTANAAHELMTPLAAIKTEVQVCQRQVQDSDSRRMLERIGLRVDRATHTVEQLLTLARLDPEAPLAETTIDLRALLTEVVAETAHLAAARDLQVDLSGNSPATVQGSAEALAILLRNLLVNAFRYADAASVIRIELQRGQAVQLEICNDCPALTAEEFGRICARFYRVPGSAGLGAGLGLSIVHRIADQHGADFHVGPRVQGDGFCARLVMPATPSVREPLRVDQEGAG